jgi:hypothetical protein
VHREAVGHRTISGHTIGNAIGQGELESIDGLSRNQQVALIDRIENRANEQRNIERAARNAVRNGEAPN